MDRVLYQVAAAVAFLVEVVERFFEDESPKLAAALAYYAIFSIPPLLIILIASVQTVFAQDDLDSALRPLASTLLSSRVASEVLALSDRARQWAQEGSWWSVVLSIGGVLFAATRGLAELHTTLNRIWGIEPKPDRGVAKTFAIKRFIALLMLCGLSLALVLSIAVDTFVEVWRDRVLAFVSEPFLSLFHSLDGILSVGIVTALLALIYRLLPDARIGLRSVLPGALFAAVLFELAKNAFASFVGRMKLSEFFGQASSLMALLVWLYMCGIVVALGAEFTQVWTLRTVGLVKAEEGSVKREPRTPVFSRQVRQWLRRWFPQLPD